MERIPQKADKVMVPVPAGILAAEWKVPGLLVDSAAFQR
jgi:hypothetical protein